MGARTGHRTRKDNRRLGNQTRVGSDGTRSNDSDPHKGRINALWTIALHAYRIDPSLFSVHGDIFLERDSLEDAVDDLLAEEPDNTPSAQAIWAFQTLYDQLYRFSNITGVSSDFLYLDALAKHLKLGGLPAGLVRPPSYELLTPLLTSICTPATLATRSCYFPPLDATSPPAYTRVSATIRVNKELQDLTKAMDPRKWHDCIQGPFLASWEAESVLKPKYPDTACQKLPWREPVLSGKTGTKLGDLIEKVIGTAGAAWDGLLFETFEIEKSGFTFHNLLNISYKHKLDSANPLNDYIRMKYDQDHNETMYSSILGVTNLADILGMNCGMIEAKRDPSDPSFTIVNGHKDLRINDVTRVPDKPEYGVGQLLRLTSPALLALWNQATNDFGLCCDWC